MNKTAPGIASVSPSALVSMYEQMEHLSGALLDASRRSDWVQVATLEKRLSALRESVMAAGQVELEPTVRDRLIELLRVTLERLAEVDRHAQPWLAALRQLASGHSNRTWVADQYRAPG